MATQGPEVISHWSQLIEELEGSPLDFYQRVQERIEHREIPEGGLSRVDYRERGPMSALREYLRAKRHEFVIDICGAPFGRGFFVSWWLGEVQSPYGILALVGVFFVFFATWGGYADRLGILQGFLLAVVMFPVLFWVFGRFLSHHIGELDAALAAMPFFGRHYRRWLSPLTYYRIDTAIMFRDAVHNAVLEVIDELTESQGLRALSEAERKPVLKRFFEE